MGALAGPLALSAVLGLLTGAALSRANLCMMRAAHDVAHARFAAVGALLIASAAGAVVFFLSGLAGWHGRAVWAWPTGLTVLGAVLFGAGARINAACSLGTVGRLAHGDLGALATIAGMVAAFLVLPRATVHDAPPPWAGTAGVAVALMMGAFVVVVLVLSQRRGGTRHLWAPLLLGAVAALLYSFQAQITWMEIATHAASGTAIRTGCMADRERRVRVSFRGRTDRGLRWRACALAGAAAGAVRTGVSRRHLDGRRVAAHSRCDRRARVLRSAER